MSAYVVYVVRGIHDQALMDQYRSASAASLERAGGRLIDAGSALVQIDGSPAEWIGIVEFPNELAARQWYFGAEYQQAVALRKQGSDQLVFLANVASETQG